MSASGWRLLSLPLAVIAFLLAGAPEFPALGRAIARVFQPDATITPPESAAATSTHRALSPQPKNLNERERNEPDNLRKPAEGAVSRRGVLVPLYVSYAALQALDAHSTFRALGGGSSEINPVMRGAAGNPVALVAIKASLAASTIYLVEKVRAQHRRAALVLMTALNSAYALVVAHNYRAATR